MKLLILGGTRFLGRHLAAQALAAGHTVALLHRGRSGAGLFPEAEHLVADRNSDLSVLDGRRWDAAIDTNAYVPRHVRQVAERLAGRVGQYQLVSTISVYADETTPGQTEDAPLATLADPATETVDAATYGGLKVQCEQAAARGFGDAALVSRPALLVGPLDPTHRFTWWLRRVQRGGELLAPAPADAPVQFIDARDAAAWMLRQAEQGTRGTFTLSGPLRRLTMGELLDTACRVLNPAARPVWVDESFLLAQGVQPWADLPLWLPRAEAGLHELELGRAARSGLVCRPLEATIADTAAWAAGQPATEGPGLAPEREQAVRAAWHATRGRGASAPAGG